MVPLRHLLALFVTVALLAASPTARADGPTTIEMLSPTAGQTAVGNVTLRARVTGPTPDDVQLHFGLPQPKDWLKLGTEVAPGIWEATYDLATVPWGTWSASATALFETSPGSDQYDYVHGPTVSFSVDRAFAIRWVGDPAPPYFSPDDDGVADALGVSAQSDGVPHDAESWVADATGARVRTLSPWFRGTDPFGNGLTLAEWNGRDDGGALLPDGWYCVRLAATGANGRHGSLARPTRVDGGPAETPAPPQPPGAWCTPPPVATDPPLVTTPYPPLPSTGSGPQTPIDTTPSSATPTTPLNDVVATPTSDAPRVRRGPLPPTGAQFTATPLLAVRSARQVRGRLLLKVRCVSGCSLGQWIDVELWTTGATARRTFATRVRVGRNGALTISRRVHGKLLATLELRAPQLGVELPVRLSRG